MTCGITQNIIKNYESYVINWIRQLAIHKRRLTIAFVLIRASSNKPQANLNQNLVQVLKQQATSIKLRAASIKRQAASDKLSDSRTTVQEN